MRTWVCVAGVFAMCASTFVSSSAQATVGGEELLDVWGWDSVRAGVVVHLDKRDGGGSFGPVILLRQGLPDSTIVLPDCRYRGDENAAEGPCPRAIRRLRSTLRPLEPSSIIEPRLPWSTRVVSRDSVLLMKMDWYPRTIVEARFAFEHYRVTTFGRTDVALVARYHLPGGATDLVILSFFGTAFEGGYETWVPVFVPRVTAEPPYVDSIPSFDVKWRGAP